MSTDALVTHTAIDQADDLRAHLKEGRWLGRHGGSAADLAQWERHDRGIRRKWKKRYASEASWRLEITTHQIETDLAAIDST